MTDTLALDAPIVGVTVYPSQARVSRRGRVSVPAGSVDVVLDNLPTTLVDESVRVAGKGAARVAGVDVSRRYFANAPDAQVEQLEARLRDLQRQQRALNDRDGVASVRAELLATLARRGGRSLADALAAGDANASAVSDFSAVVATELEAVAADRRDVADQLDDVAKQIAVVENELALRRGQAQTERRQVTIALEADAPADVDVEVTYLVSAAGWSPSYDARLSGTTVTLTWFGMVSQRTGENWPSVDLALSTARPATSAGIPELDPWYVDAWQPRPMATRARVAAAAGEPVRDMAFEAQAIAAPAAAPLPPVQVLEATAEQGVAAVTWRLPRPVAVPSDGAPHKTTITSFDLDASLDFVCVPKLAKEAYLRATVTNSSAQTLLPGRVSVFHDADFVGTTVIEAVPPGAEVELQLGVDDRIAVERELTHRDTSKNLLGSTRRVAVTYEITVENHSAEPAKIAVKDQFPVSRHERIKVEDRAAKPDPAAQDDLGEVTWSLALEPGGKGVCTLTFQLEHPKDLQVTGFYD